LIKARKFVKGLMVDPSKDWSKKFLHVTKINGPTHYRVQRRVDVEPQGVRVAVNSSASIALRRRREK
jgi:hypothetical protein